MAVNYTNFYKVMNELVNRATGSTSSEPMVVDYNSFIDTGKKITELSASDLRNNFLDALINRIAKVILVQRSYEGAYKELDRGMIPYGNTIEMVMYRFFEAQVAPFVELTNGESVDMFVIAKPEVDANYYVNTNAFSFPVTIQRDQLIKAWASPGEMESFIAGIMLYIRNTTELQREQGRIGMVADWIRILDAQTAEVADEDKPAMKYKILSIYNAHTGAGLTADNCLYNSEFVKFLTAAINKVSARLAKVSESYNVEGKKTFTRPDQLHLFASSVLTSAISTYVPKPYLNNASLSLNGAIEVPYWQSEAAPLVVKSDVAGTGQSETESAPVVAVLLDKYALGEYLKTFSTETTPYNTAGKYWNVWTSIETRYLINKYANSVIFTLE